MPSTDPIADMLTQIRNAIMVGRPEIKLPYSSTKKRLAKILVASGFLKAVSDTTEDDRKLLNITINESDRPATITEIKRLSSPGRRHYTKAVKIPTVKSGRGIVVLSTSNGLMTGEEAKAKGLGGELICQVY